jgi:hypothetical protein
VQQPVSSARRQRRTSPRVLVDNQLLTIATDRTASGFIIDKSVTAMHHVIHQNYTYLSATAPNGGGSEGP